MRCYKGIIFSVILLFLLNLSFVAADLTLTDLTAQTPIVNVVSGQTSGKVTTGGVLEVDVRPGGGGSTVKDSDIIGNPCFSPYENERCRWSSSTMKADRCLGPKYPPTEYVQIDNKCKGSQNVKCCVKRSTVGDKCFDKGSELTINDAEYINSLDVYYVEKAGTVVTPVFAVPDEVAQTTAEKKIWIWMAYNSKNDKSYYNSPDDAKENLNCFYQEKTPVTVIGRNFYWVDETEDKLQKTLENGEYWLDSSGKLTQIAGGMLNFNAGEACQSGLFFAKYLYFKQYQNEYKFAKENMKIYVVVEENGKAKGEETASEFGVIAGNYVQSTINKSDETYYFKYCVGISSGEDYGPKKPTLTGSPGCDEVILAVGKKPPVEGEVVGPDECSSCTTIVHCLGCIDKVRFVDGLFEEKSIKSSVSQDCAGEGETIGAYGMPIECCAGLTPVGGWPGGYEGDCSIRPPATGLLICSNCGNGFCNINTGENKCNCPQDCA